MSDKPTSAAGTTSEHSALLKQALRALEQMKQKLAAAEQLAAESAESRLKEPIAIVGMGCRFPGEATSPEAFWQMLRAGREAIREVPADRWEIDKYYDPDPTVPGKMVTRFGGFMEKIDEFDASFFGIAPREAAMMDPQQRLLLEVAWRALESGGIAPGSLAGSKTGMYLGIASGDYALLQMQSGDAGLLDVHYASGNAHSTASGRLSYLLGLKGPSLSVDTACSSSLVAVHLACQALRTGECSLAIAGGVNVILAPETTVALSQAHMLAPDGRSKAFDDAADGFARAEGCGVVVLKPLAKALADRDRVLAVIRGTALNQDGASSSLTAPNGPSQEELMRAALENAGIDAARVGYVEAHGTGTSLGDPIELRALGAVYGAAHSGDGGRVLVGSLKTNFGHMEAAAGIGGLIKLVLSLQHGEVPAHLQFERPTRHVNWEALRLAVTTTTRTWPEIAGSDGKPALRVGAVSSFGFSGTNAHLVVEQAPVASVMDARDGDMDCLLPVSARSPEALRELVAEYGRWLEGDAAGKFSWAAIAATAGQGRDHFRYRAAVVAGDRAEASAGLALLSSQAEFGTASGAQALCFLFTGQGSERAGMGLALLERSGVFRAAVERLDAALAGSLGMPIASIWAGAGGELQTASLVQPALYAYGWALSEVWRSFGVEPSVVMGHSLGEYVAATVAGVMTPEEGIRLVAARGRLTETLAEPGGMVAVAASLDAVGGLLAPGLSVAAVNGPASVVISGRRAEIEAFEERVKAGGLRHKRLRTTHGFHSAALEPMLDAFEAEAGRIAFRVPEVKWISNLTGQAVERKRPVDAAYWRRHLRETVQFAEGLGSLAATGATVFLELGVEPQLLALAADNGIEARRQVASIAKSGAGGEWRKVLTAAGQLYTLGVPLDWKGTQQGAAYRRVDLPGYPFERRRFWFNEGTRAQASDRVSQQAGGPGGSISATATGHPLLGSRLRTHSETAMFQAELSATHPAHFGDHVVLGRRILPGAAYLEIAVAAAREVWGDTDSAQGWSAVEVEFREACVFDEPRLLETVLSSADGKRRFTIASAPSGEAGAWTVHATGVLEPLTSLMEDGSSKDLAAIREGAAAHWEQDAFYDRFRAAGLDFGLAFQPVVRAWGGNDESLVEFEGLAEVLAEGSRYVLHPVLLDACLQAAAALDEGNGQGAPRLPAALDAYRLSGDPKTLRYARARVRQRTGRGITVDIHGLNADGRLVLELEGLRLVEAAQARARDEDQFQGWLHQVVWERLALESEKEAEFPIDPVVWRQELEAYAKRAGLVEFDRTMADFDELCAAWIAEAFETGGFVLTPGRLFAIGEVLETLSVAQEHIQLTGRFLQILTEFGYLGSELGRYRVLGKVRPAGSGIERLSATGYPEIAWALQTRRQLLPLLRGEVKPVDVLFADGGHQIATRLYRESVVARIFQPALASAARVAAERLGGRARVLEVGGGTAATTSYLVPALGDSIAEYVWTDIGAGFASAARREFADRPKMRFQTLDLERDPAEQGLGGEQFDIVVASNVIHATADIRQTLRHLHALTRPGGVLLMMETVGKRQPWVDLTVGFTDGWWRFTDRDLRPDYPVLSRADWIAVLAQEGFGSIALAPDEAAEMAAGDGATLSRQCLIASVARPLPQGESSEAVAAPVLMLSNGWAENAWMREALRAEAESCGAAVTVASADDVDRDWLQAWFRNSQAINAVQNADIFYLVGAETETIPDGGGEDALAWQDRVLGGALALAQAILAADLQRACRLWLVSRETNGPGMREPDGATLAGFARSMRAEYPEAQVFCVDVGLGPGMVPGLWSLSRRQLGGETQFALREGAVWVPRLVPWQFSQAARPTEVAAVGATTGVDEVQRLHFAGSGLLEDLKPRTELRKAPGGGEVEVAIRATAVNFHEVLSALDADASHDEPPGGECVGVVLRVGAGVEDLQPGDPVVAIGLGLMADYATLMRNRMWKKPEGLGDEDAATLTIPFLTARWSLERVAQLQPGETVLIHSAAGGVGLAAMQEARRLGALVIATAGTEEKRAYLRALGVEHVFDSRTCAFEGQVLAATGFQGVDVVLNSLGGDKVAAGLRTLAPGGRFVELGEKTALTEQQAKSIRPDVRYLRVHLRAALGAATPEIRAMIGAVLADVETGMVKPLPWTQFALADAAEAFRLMATGQHTGRVLLTMGPATAEGSRFGGFRRDGAYVVTGGFAGLGLLLVEWLAQQGSGCVLALGRSEPGPEARAVFARVRELGLVVIVVQCDVSEEEPLAEALRMVPEGFVLRGVFHSAGALDDASIPQQTAARLRNVLSAKVAGAWNLHRLTLAAELDCFVLFSSAAGVLGSRGQANHAAANAYLDALAHYRRERQGLTALSIDWGAWSGVGAAVRYGVVARSEGMGAAAIGPADGLRLLRRLLDENCTQVMVSKVDWRKWAASYKGQALPNRDLLTHVLAGSGAKAGFAIGVDLPREPQLTVRSVGEPGAGQPSAHVPWLEQLRIAAPARQRAMLDAQVEQRVRAALALPANQLLDPGRPLQEYGLDSLLSIELRNALSSDLEVKLPATILFDYPTLGSLTDWLFQGVLKLGVKPLSAESRMGEPSVSGFEPAKAGGQRASLDVAELSDDEVERLFQQKMAGVPK